MIGGEFRIDLLFYHLKLHRYFVFELKTKDAHPEHIGKGVEPNPDGRPPTA
ncbi:PDDEXK nuclease domain-containing protein [Streptomyces sp. NPDC058308]|uniref:PDDEXK nuclease domain-containing protein n=1 Tax=Streptomyces sp. NPDC058308 TaxID=3346440 RepID=UPI0036ED67DE